MSQPNQFQVNPDQLHGHASTVSDIADGLSSVASGLSGPDEGALGTFVQFLTAGLASAATKTTDSISNISSAMGDVSTGLTQTAQRYSHTDQHNASNLEQL